MLLVSGANPAIASGFQTGSNLLILCTSKMAVDEVLCLGYLSGAIDAYTDGNQKSYKYNICLPAGITRQRLKDVVVEYLRQNPKMSDYDAAPSIYIASAIEFPCPAEKK